MMATPRLSLPAGGRLLGLLLVALLLGMGCSGKDGVAPPQIAPQQVQVDSGVVSWTTVEPARAAVRYGFASGDYDHVAYPAAASRQDRALRTQHRVPLLDLAVGRTVFFQALSENEQGSLQVSAEQEFTPQAGGPGGMLTSSMIHIGWGDCHLITMPTSGKRFLIDAGEGGAADAVQEYFAQHGVESLDAALATHVHWDHIGGFVGDDNDPEDGVLEFAPPAVFFDSPSKTHFRSAYADVLGILEERSIPRRVLERGDSDQTVDELALDPEVSILVLNSGLAPDVPVDGYDGNNINNESIVLRFSYGDVDFVIGGDAEYVEGEPKGTEESIVAAFPASQLDAEYFKAHHHGRYDGNSSALLNAIKPRVSLVPVSASEYSNGIEGLYDASAAPFARIESVGADLYVIDDLATMGLYRGSGANHNITFATDGLSYEIRAELARQTAKLPALRTSHRCEEHPEPVADPHGS